PARRRLDYPDLSRQGRRPLAESLLKRARHSRRSHSEAINFRDVIPSEARDPRLAVIPSGVPCFFSSRGLCAARDAVEGSLFDVTPVAMDAVDESLFDVNAIRGGRSRRLII